MQSRTDAALWLAPGIRPNDVIDAVRDRLDVGRQAEFLQPGEIRRLSLDIFDRSFAVTYLLEVAAIVIGLIGIAATFSSQALARTKEFGMLRHLGVTRRQILGQFAIEGLLVTLLGIASGLAAGFAVALVLIHVVNPQSFHWTMELHVPAGLIAAAGRSPARDRDADRAAGRSARSLGRSGARRAGGLVTVRDRCTRRCASHVHSHRLKWRTKLGSGPALRAANKGGLLAPRRGAGGPC